MTRTALPYRPCVGIVLFDANGRVWIGRRIPKAHDRHALPDGATEAPPHVWQMPQGGIDAGESPEEAALRELAEETGVTSVRILAETRDWLTYDLPPHLVGIALRGQYRGQKQKWFAMRFLGDESEIDIGPGHGEEPEFDAWRWARPDELPALIVPFKRRVYEQVLREFAPFAEQPQA